MNVLECAYPGGCFYSGYHCIRQLLLQALVWRETSLANRRSMPKEVPFCFYQEPGLSCSGLIEWCKSRFLKQSTSTHKQLGTPLTLVTSRISSLMPLLFLRIWHLTLMLVQFLSKEQIKAQCTNTFVLKEMIPKHLKLGLHQILNS